MTSAIDFDAARLYAIPMRTRDELESIDLKPTALKGFILADREALLVEAGTVG